MTDAQAHDDELLRLAAECEAFRRLSGDEVPPESMDRIVKTAMKAFREHCDANEAPTADSGRNAETPEGSFVSTPPAPPPRRGTWYRFVAACSALAATIAVSVSIGWWIGYTEVALELKKAKGERDRYLAEVKELKRQSVRVDEHVEPEQTIAVDEGIGMNLAMPGSDSEGHGVRDGESTDPEGENGPREVPWAAMMPKFGTLQPARRCPTCGRTLATGESPRPLPGQPGPVLRGSPDNRPHLR